MLGDKKLVAFIAARDAARAKAFYGGTLGLRLLSEDAFALVFDANGTMLRVQIVPDAGTANYTRLGWEVADINSIASALEAAGCSLQRFPGMNQDEHGIWISPVGARVAWIRDPDDNLLSITQFP